MNAIARRNAVLYLLGQGLGKTEIARRLNLHRVTVHRLIKSEPLRSIDHEKVLELHDAGKSPGAIARALGCNRTTVSRITKAAGRPSFREKASTRADRLPKRQPKFGEEEIARLYVESELTVRDIGRLAGIHEDTVRRIAWRHGAGRGRRWQAKTVAA